MGSRLHNFLWSNSKLIFVGLLILTLGCKNNTSIDKVTPKEVHTGFVDSNADESVYQLHEKLIALKSKGFAIGHQDATSYGIGWDHSDDPDYVDSDVKRVTNSYPAVFGFDIGHLELGNTHNLDSVPFDVMRDLIIDAHKRGGIITVSWHLDNPVTGGDSWDRTKAISAILPAGNEHEKYNVWLRRIADFFKSLAIDDETVPVIFRPFHEMNGAWFWWGLPNTSPENYIALWQYTVAALRDRHDVHNLLYAYSPNTLTSTKTYLKAYPGDAYVDILGIDVYDFENINSYKKQVANNLKILQEIAIEKNKLFAFTETGLETISKPNWFTEELYPQIATSGISWILFWRNHSTEHHYMSFPNHESEEDFKKFEELEETLFLDDIHTFSK